MTQDESSQLLTLTCDQTDGGFVAQIVSQLFSRIRNVARKTTLIQSPQLLEVFFTAGAQLETFGYSGFPLVMNGNFFESATTT